MLNIPKIPESKTLAFVFLGILLYFGSVYFNIQQENSADLGISLSIILIAFGILAQSYNWAIYWQKKNNEHP